MQIRKLEIKDILEINKIRNYYIENTNYIFRTKTKTYDEDLKFFEDILKNDYPLLTCIDNDQVIGFAYLYPFRALDGYNQTMELSIYLSPSNNHKGIGTKLLQEIENLAKTKYHSIISVITSSNKKSIKFHEKNNYKNVGEIKEVGFLNNQYLDVTLMQKILYKTN